MTLRTTQLILACTAIVGVCVPSSTAAEQGRATDRLSTQKHRAARTDPLPCGDYMAFQVLLDRQGFSPGQIDGKPGPNFTHALAAFRSARNLAEAPSPDCDTWRALEGESTDATTSYTITEQDVK